MFFVFRCLLWVTLYFHGLVTVRRCAWLDCPVGLMIAIGWRFKALRAFFKEKVEHFILDVNNYCGENLPVVVNEFDTLVNFKIHDILVVISGFHFVCGSYKVARKASSSVISPDFSK